MIDTSDTYIYFIIALLPLSACMLVLQTNPYNALVIRGILGAVAAMVYSILGAADVALTEALMGTMLAITLYAIAVRSSMILRLGVLEEAATEANKNSPELENLVANIRAIFTKRHMRLELVKYTDTQALQHGLKEKEVHAICVHTLNKKEPLKTITRLQRIYDIMQAELSSETTLTYVNTSDLEANINEMDLRISRDSVVR
jgi:putative multicomponent Na+:H+ antiporter subunit B